MRLKIRTGGARLLTSPAREYARPTKGMKSNETSWSTLALTPALSPKERERDRPPSVDRELLSAHSLSRTSVDHLKATIAAISVQISNVRLPRPLSWGRGSG